MDGLKKIINRVRRWFYRHKIEVESVTAPSWKNPEELKELKEYGLGQTVSRIQRIYTSKLGRISLVRFLDYYYKGHNFWEIYGTKGNLFPDVERFGTRKEAEARITELLE